MHRPRLKLGVILLAAQVLSGCQSYQPRPLDLEGHRARWLQRDPGGPEVAAFAASLASTEPAAPAPFDLSDGLALHEAEIVALLFNTDLRIARLRADVSQAGAEHAGQWSDPTLSLDVMRALESVPERWKIFSMIGFMLPISGRLEAEKARAGAERAADLARVYQQEWSVRVALRSAWAEWSAAEARSIAAREFVTRLEHVVGIADRLYAAGELSAADARPFTAERASRRIDLSDLHARAVEAELTVKALLGLSPAAPLQLVSAFPAPGPAQAPPEVTRHSPSLSVAAMEYEISERDLALEIRKQYPDLSIGGGYGSEEGEPQALLSLSFPLPVLNANRQAIAQARARRELARAVYETTYERLAGSLAAATVRCNAARARRLLLETELVPLVDAQYEDARKIAELGEVNTLLLLDSLSRQYEAKLRLVDATLAESAAALQVQELVGPPEATAPAPHAVDPTPQGVPR